MKKKISFILAVAMICTMVAPFSAFAVGTPSVQKVDGEYYFDAFSNTFATSDVQNQLLTDIAYYNNASGNLITKVYDTDNYAVTGESTTAGNLQGGAYTYAFYAPKAKFEDANKKVVLTYDLFYSGDTTTSANVTANIGFVDWHYTYGTTDTGCRIGAHLSYVTRNQINYSSLQKKPYLTYNDGTYDFSSDNNHFGNISAVANGTYLDVPAGGRWLKMQTVLEYDSTDESYNSTYYVDGSPIKTKDGNVAVTKITISDSTRQARLRDNRAYMCFSIQGLNSRVAVDNVSLRLVNAASGTAPATATVSGDTITIPFENTTNIANTAAAPEQVKLGYLNADTASNAVVTQASTGTELTTENKIEGNKLIIKIKENLENEKIKVNLAGVKDIMGNQVALDNNEYAVTANIGSYNIQNNAWYQTFEGYTADTIDTLGFYRSTSQANTTNPQAVLDATHGKNGSVAMAWEGSSNRVISGPGKYANTAFLADAAHFENSGKVLEYGFDVFIPGTRNTGEAVTAQLAITTSGMNNPQWISRTPAMSQNGDGIKFTSYNADSLKSDWGATAETNANIFTAVNFPNDFNSKTSVVTDTVPDKGKWVKLSSRVAYMTDANGGYYLTTFYVDGKIMRNADGSPAVMKLQKETDGSTVSVNNRGSFEFQVGINPGNGVGDDVVYYVDNMYMKLVNPTDAEELNIYDIETSEGGKTASFVYNNLSQQAQSYQFIIAGYDSDGKLVAVDVSKTGEIPARSTGTVSSTLESDKTITSYRAYLWDGFSNCNPLK